MCSAEFHAFYVLRRCDGRGFVSTEDGETFQTVASRQLASAFCSHLVHNVRRDAERQIGARFRLVRVSGELPRHAAYH